MFTNELDEALKIQLGPALRGRGDEIGSSVWSNLYCSMNFIYKSIQKGEEMNNPLLCCKSS